MHLSREEVRAEEDVVSSRETRDAVMWMYSTAPSVWTITSEKKLSISVNGRRYRTYVRSAYRSKNDFYATLVLDNGYIELLGVAEDRYDAFEELKYGRVVVVSIER